MRSSIISALVFFLACSGNSLRVGSDESESGGRSGAGGTAGTSSAGTNAGGVGAAAPTTGAGATVGLGGTMDMDAGPPITSCNETFPFEGEWSGNLLDYLFEPMEGLRLSIRAQGGEGGYVGNLTWGTGDPPAPATDPDAPYPPGLNVGGAAGTGAGRNANGTDYFAGYPYEIVRGAGCDGVFRITLSSYEIWDSWCRLQPSYYSENALRWACAEVGYGASFDGTTCRLTDEDNNFIAEYPIWKCGLCGVAGTSVCACDASGCWASPETTHSFELSLIQADGVDVLTGPYDSCQCTMRLEREE